MSDAVPVELITVTIDGTQVQVPKGTLAIRAAESIGIDIPRFCDHPLLDPAAACRACLVTVPDAGNGRGMPVPQPSCSLVCMPGMVIETGRTSERARKAQEGMLEFMLINHPLDCPICDKGGECPLQNQAMAHGRGESRYDGVKRTYPKPLAVSDQILLDRERCVLCQRCTRFADQIAGDPFIALAERGAHEQVGFDVDDQFDSYFSGNVVQICPVGALTSRSYRFNARPFDLVSTPTTCEQCAAGCQLRVDHRHFQVKRRLAGNAPEVNEEWSCDKGRFAFVSARGDDRLAYPLVRENGELRSASWPEAIEAAAAGLKEAGTSVGVITGGRLTMENAYAYAKFARLALGTNNVDFRTRPSGADEADFLAAHVVGRGLGDGPTYTDLENAKRVVLVAFEPEDEAPMVFLRLRKAVRKKRLKVVTVAPLRSRGSKKLNADVVTTAPGGEAAALIGLELDADTIVLVGERAASVPELLATVAKTATDAGAAFAWVPRRAGDRGAIDAGCLPNLLPGGYALGAQEVADRWGAATLPSGDGLDASDMLDGALGALVIAGADPADFVSSARVRDGLDKTGFVVCLEQRFSEIAQAADVVFPVALLEEQGGTFLDWENRPGRVNVVNTQATTAMTDLRVLCAIADGMGTSLGFATTAEAEAELSALVEANRGGRHTASSGAPVAGERNTAAADGYRLATWRQLLDLGRGQDGEDHLAATARPSVVRIGAADATTLGVADGQDVTVGGPEGSVTLPLVVDASVAEGTVWLPMVSPGSLVSDLGVGYGGLVTLTTGERA